MKKTQVAIEKEGSELKMTGIFPTAERSWWDRKGEVVEALVAPAGGEWPISNVLTSLYFILFCNLITF